MKKKSSTTYSLGSDEDVRFCLKVFFAFLFGVVIGLPLVVELFIYFVKP